MKTIIIAEIGVNHNGKVEFAKKLIDKAKIAKVDFVKFQSYISDELVIPDARLANYQKKTNLKNQFELLKKYEFSFEQQKKLFNYCKRKNVKFISTPFDFKSLNFISKFNMSTIKISSTDLGNLPLLNKVAKLKRKVFLSTGMSTNNEIKISVDELLKNGLKKNDITLLHCHSAYPTSFENINLKSILFLRDKFNLRIGFSDHSLGIEASLAAVALGATVIEKHFTLDKKMSGPDHSSSLDFNELVDLVKKTRNLEKSLGIKKKLMSSIEKRNRLATKRSIFANKVIEKGDYFTEENICTKRPETGIPAYKWYKVLGKKAKKRFKVNEKITL